ncbi:MAG: hypothetical protein LQ342_005282 [Letrouitia transgressa]|nr:MAG: hypothetical protein LQ342_005282 [Letrouitia transgressa]
MSPKVAANVSDIFPNTVARRNVLWISTYLDGIFHEQYLQLVIPDTSQLDATLRTLFSAVSNSQSEVLDNEALVLYFPAPRTVTGEDVVEFHVHGGNAVVKSVLAAIPGSNSSDSPSGIRYAEPGEFTQRGFYNNRLDLTQIEALADTLSAETEQQRKLAIKGHSRILAERYESWRQQLLLARGELEALIDFSEDQHFDETPATLVESVTAQIHQLIDHIKASFRNASHGELLRNGINIALVGAPNAGKSSLLNRIVGREAAIVSREEGTTRDVIDVGVDIGGFFCKLGDLAGLRDRNQQQPSQISEVEQEGIRRAKERAYAADLVVVVFSIETKINGKDHDTFHVPINPEVAQILNCLDLKRQKVVYVINKSDLLDDPEEAETLLSRAKGLLPSTYLPPSDVSPMAISCKEAGSTLLNKTHGMMDSGGMQNLLSNLVDMFKIMTATSLQDPANWDHSLGVSQRQKLLLEECLRFLGLFITQANVNPAEDDETGFNIVLAAESLRSAADCLAKITGKGVVGNVEEVLGVVFEK